VPEKGQWRLTDLQRFIVVIMVVAALFLAAMALGMGSLVLVLVAAAMLVIAGLGVFLLGLFYNGRGGVQGTAEVHAVSPPPVGNIRGRCDLRLLVRFDGRAAVMMKHRDPAVPVSKWPEVGMTLPVDLPADKPGQLRILWDRVSDVSARDGEQSGAESMPVYTEYAEELHAPGLAYEYEDSPTPPTPTRPEPQSSADPLLTPTIEDPHLGDLTDLENLNLDDLDLADLDRLNLDDLDLDDLDLSDLDLEAMDLKSLDLDAPDPGGPDAGGHVEPLAEPTVEVEPVRDRSGRDAQPSGSPLPSRGAERPAPAPVPQPRAEPVPRTISPTPVDAEVVEDGEAAGGSSAFDPGGMDVMLIVSSLKTSLAFYEGMLHLPVVDATEATAVLSSGSGRIILQQMAQMSPVERRVMHLQLRVRNVEAVYQDLRRRGVTFAHRPKVIWPTDRDEVTVATCRDPDGHAVSLTEWRVRRAGGPPSPSD
jgi:catechol 2,3-dioxygenase-like lactoylglutathione lyase family enzyme